MENKKTKPRILIFVQHYLPSYKSGGPVRSISNLVNHLSDEFEFFIVTKDRDATDLKPFSNVKVDEWNKVGNAEVYYASPSWFSIQNIQYILQSVEADLVYLNSFFDYKTTILPLITRKLNHVSVGSTPFMVAPRGEFSPGAIRLKWVKKKMFIMISKIFGLYKSVSFQATSSHDKNDIIKILGNVDVKIASNLPSVTDKTNISTHFLKMNEGDNHSFRVIFLSRITRKKNLDFSLRILKHVRTEVVFDIYGPIRDEKYWFECQNEIKSLPANISVNYCGAVKPHEVLKIFSGYDLFLFPTHGENYGHVILESLLAGTQVIISDQTPWKNLKKDGLGFEIPLSMASEEVAKLIEEVSQVSFEDRLRNKKRIIDGIQNRLDVQKTLNENRNLFINSIK